ncbi:RNA polymerase sigma-70 factor, ECF subfamily [Cyclonatronum proteinivorum]|uniref:RNA polymerase sigma-70 factor, ECF subfamily n=1 Tax=Cyclonatronum proteinivorum TaxID=1457365 RepID=A0A345UN25_9BACT|nr:RNA polymerase sigma-70 factor [Cyclonatronum proteinivorum]AXJ01877.1 RNA polymerase sigma-70 factor, ECF subfamily [Cyclonatronum proteinivorum]
MIKGLRRGNKQAFEELFLAFFEPLCGYALGITSDRQASECAVQETFLRLWERCETITDDMNIKAWLFKSVRNRCLDLLRHSAMRDKYQQDIITDMKLEESLNTYEERYADDEALIAKVNREVQRLPDPIRETYLLHRQDGLTYSEISEVLGLPQKTIESRISKALKLLRERLDRGNLYSVKTKKISG